jgi:hypothetical protein
MLHRLALLVLLSPLASACQQDTALPYVPERVGGLVPVDAGVDLAARDLRPPPDLSTPPDMVRLVDLSLLPGYPAAHPPLPQVQDIGGRVLASPEITPVVFGTDQYEKDLDTLVNAIGKSSYWHAVTAEYGVGPAHARPMVHVAQVPMGTLDDSDIQAWLADQLDGTHMDFGTANASSLFLLFYPAALKITISGAQSCVEFGGYHNSATLANGMNVAYGVLPRCFPDPGLNRLQTLTVDTSHEIIEAVTDPDPLSAPAYWYVDTPNLGWHRAMSGSEVGDLCVDFIDWTTRPADVGYTVQRTWSNEAARASHDPCVPAPLEYYFNSAPVLTDAVTIIVDNVTTRKAPGMVIPLGQSRTIEVDLFSDGPLPAWTLDAMNAAQSTADFGFAFDKASGANGDKVHLTVTANARDPRNQAAFVIVSTLNGRSHRWPVAVAIP